MSNLSNEYINIHDDDGELEYTCGQCEESFQSNWKLWEEENHDIPIECNRCIKISSMAVNK
jgi:DNA-directed RNA polymerase subunit RPC12/RpoP